MSNSGAHAPRVNNSIMLSSQRASKPMGKETDQETPNQDITSSLDWGYSCDLAEKSPQKTSSPRNTWRPCPDRACFKPSMMNSQNYPSCQDKGCSTPLFASDLAAFHLKMRLDKRHCSRHSKPGSVVTQLWSKPVADLISMSTVTAL